MTVTQWFSPDIDPVYEGWYHTTIDNQRPDKPNADNEAYLCWWWDGCQWRIAPNFNALPFQNRWWRGMAK